MSVGRAELANIGPKETRKRLLMGVAMLGMGVVLALIFTHGGISRGWYAACFCRSGWELSFFPRLAKRPESPWLRAARAR